MIEEVAKQQKPAAQGPVGRASNPPAYASTRVHFGADCQFVLNESVYLIFMRGSVCKYITEL